MKHFSHLNTAVQLIEQYKGEMPFSIVLRSFFAQHKKYGSKDRKRIAHLCYCCFRLGKALQGSETSIRIQSGLFLCSDQPDELLEHLQPRWNQSIHKPVEEKIQLLRDEGVAFALADVFPWKALLSKGIDHELFCRSFLIQPDLFLRLRPGHEENVKRKLQAASIRYDEIEPDCLALPNASKLDDIIAIDKEAVVQDLNSQRTGSFLPSIVEGSEVESSPSGAEGSVVEAPPSVVEGSVVEGWDCCAASGGKSILAYDLLPGIKLTVSDIRDSIIQNLRQRFQRAGIKNYNAFVLDLATPNPPAPNNKLQTTNPKQPTPNNKQPTPNHKPQTTNYKQPPTFNLQPSTFHLILLDAPCSGSGTWGRTPEQLAFFDTSRIAHYTGLQKNIASNVMPYLKPNGRLVYITCSVFKQENEDAVNFILNNFPVKLERMEVLKGYDKKADTLFAAAFVRE